MTAITARTRRALRITALALTHPACLLRHKDRPASFDVDICVRCKRPTVVYR